MKYIFSLALTLPIILSAQDHDKIILANEYFQQAELEKAELIYNNLADSYENIPLIISNYLYILKVKHNYKTAESFLKSSLKIFPSNLQFSVHLLSLYVVQADENKTEEYIKELEDKHVSSPFQLGMLAQYMVEEELYDLALYFFKAARREKGDSSAYALEMAFVYGVQNNNMLMIEEYLNYAAQNESRMNYVKNLLQNIMQGEKEFSELEGVLIQRMQRNPGNNTYGELLIWVELQRKNFYGAFIQARSIDRRKGDSGNRSMDVGLIAIDNKAWDDAIHIFKHVASQYKDSPNYSRARKYEIEAREKKVKSVFPINKEEVRSLVIEYDKLYREFNTSHISLESLLNKALLYAFYLNETDSAVALLSKLIEQPKAGRLLVAKSKLHLGDIYLLKGIHWEATLLYSQVEKSYKSSLVGYEAKLKNARLQYFIGNFSLSKGNLDILKINTTREISNDAIALGMLITDNTAFDTIDQVMKEFANIELKIFQNLKHEAKERLLAMMTTHKHHAIADEIYWLLAKIELEFGNTQLAISYLDKILVNYSFDILADDAAFLKAEIYDYQLKDVEQAKAHYWSFLVDYPGSMYAAAAQKRFRQLRGDLLN